MADLNLFNLPQRFLSPGRIVLPHHLANAPAGRTRPTYAVQLTHPKHNTPLFKADYEEFLETVVEIGKLHKVIQYV